MLHVICGEDTISSRQYFSTLKDEYTKKGYEIQSVVASELDQISKNESPDITLFGSTKIYVIENAQSAVSRSKKGAVNEAITAIAKSTELTLIDWENGKSLREVSIAKLGESREFKPSKSIFMLLDACYPGNKKQFVSLLHQVTETQDEGFIFAMLARHTRTLLLSSANALPSSVPSWMKGKLFSQSSKWKLEKLSGFYVGLSRIDTGLKTSSNVFGYAKSLDILSCYYL